MCQAFYNTKIIEVVNKLIGSVDNRCSYIFSILSPSLYLLLSFFFASIREEFERKLKRGGRSSNNNKSNGAAAAAGARGSPGSPQRRQQEGSMVSSSLYQISIPEGLESRTYGALFQLLCKRKQIPLGNS